MGTEGNKNIQIMLHQEINQIADQLCLSVQGDFDFTIISPSQDEVIQKLCLLINFVIDAARRALHDVQTQNKKLTEVDQLKSDFITNINHELRTPLTLLLGPLELILKDKTLILPSQHLDNLHRIQRNAARLYLLMNDLLDFSKIDAGCFTIQNSLLDINQYLLELVDDAQGLAKERNIELHYTGLATLGEALIDEKIIEKILLNLLSNSLKFTPDNGTIAVYLEQEHGLLKLIVRDTGIGITAENLPHIFDRFYQVDSGAKSYSGTGIGLALVKQLVDLLHGTIHVTSKVAQGTSFTLTLPVNTPTLTQTAKLRRSANPEYTQTSLWLLSKSMTEATTIINDKGHKAEKELTKPLVLIADDNSDMRAFMQVLLEDRFEIMLAENGKEALNLIAHKPPQVILTDAMMPEMDGYQLTKLVKSNPKTRHIPIILVTAKTGNESIISGLDVGADDYLSKPFLPEELIARIEASLRTYYDYVALTQANLKLEQEIEERKKLEFKNNELNGQLVLAARQAGMADIANSVLHNIGNVLNSANISTSMINQYITNSRISDLEQISNLLEQNQDGIGHYLTNDEQGKHLIQYLKLLADSWKEDYSNLINETNLLKSNIEHIRNIIMQQQSLGRTGGFTEKTSIPELIEHCIALNNISSNRIEVVREYEALQEVVIDKVKLMQIIVNLIKNSKDSVMASTTEQKKITVHTYEQDELFFVIEINDNGLGIAPKHRSKIFSYGFTTKKTGHGFGLHASAISIQEMSGTLTMDSEGLTRGATFTIVLPYNRLKGDSHGKEANSSSR